MTFLPLMHDDELDAQARAARERRLEQHDEAITATEATLLAHLPSFTAYQQWYPLRDSLVPFIGERAVCLFSYAICDESDSLAGSAFFRRILIDTGEDPDNPQVTEAEQLLIDWGRLIVRSPADIPQPFYDRLERAFNPQLRVALLAFAGQLVAGTLFATVGKVPLEPELYPYRRPGDERSS